MNDYLSQEKTRKAQKLTNELRREFPLYVMLLPGLALLIIFNYIPMYGVVMAFQNFKPALGYFASKWVGLKHFQRIMTDPLFMKAFRNTIVLGVYSLIISFPAPIILALMFNEIKHSAYKRVVQTISYLPYFLSGVIVVGIFKDMLSINDGIVNQVIAGLGLSKIDFFTREEWFRTLYIGTGIWQGVGYSSIIYLAAISGVNPELYEAAVLDGASRLKQATHITIPSIIPTIVILFIFAVGGIVGSDWQKILLIYAPTTYNTSDVISTYVYRSGIEGSSQSYAAAVGLFNSVISLALIIGANTLAKKVGETSLW